MEDNYYTKAATIQRSTRKIKKEAKTETAKKEEAKAAFEAYYAKTKTTSSSMRYANQVEAALEITVPKRKIPSIPIQAKKCQTEVLIFVCAIHCPA